MTRSDAGKDVSTLIGRSFEKASREACGARRHWTRSANRATRSMWQESSKQHAERNQPAQSRRRNQNTPPKRGASQGASRGASQGAIQNVTSKQTETRVGVQAKAGPKAVHVGAAAVHVGTANQETQSKAVHVGIAK